RAHSRRWMRCLHRQAHALQGIPDGNRNPVDPSMNASPHIAAHPPRILIVDDERHNRQLLEVMLAPEGFQLLTATNGEEALAMVAQQPPDVILLDVMMPGTNGYRVADQIKGNLDTKNIPIIMITALS